MWAHITSRYYDFDQFQEDAERVSNISCLELLSFYDDFIAVSSKRRKVSVHMRSRKISKFYSDDESNEMAACKSKSIIVTDDELNEFKENLDLTSEPMPVKPFSAWKL
jgi:insulysin